MIAASHKKPSRPRMTDRRRDILREFFANAVVLAAIKTGDTSVARKSIPLKK